MKLNVGCGNIFEGDVRIDLIKTKAVNLLADAHFLPFKDKVFTHIICTEVLEHLKSPFNALKEIYRVLKINGEIMITVPNLTELRRILSISKNPMKVRNIDTDHKQGWDPIEFTRLANQAKLKIIKINWIDRDDREKRREKFKFLNPILKLVLPKSLYCYYLEIICTRK